MVWKELIEFVFPGISKNIDEEYSKDDLSKLDIAEKKIILRDSQLSDCRDSKQVVLDKLEDYKETTLTLIEEVDSLKDQIESIAEKPVDIPSADITYIRPCLVGKNKWKQKPLDVRKFIMADFEIENEVKRAGLVYDGTQNLDELIPKIYHLAKKNYKYGFDNIYGFSEFWMFPFELRAVRKEGLAGDCDDWAIKIGSYFAAAKIPRNRWLISAGETRTEIGHATVYAKDSTGVWRHLNSTKPEFQHFNLKQYPSNKDQTDSLGIKEDGFWFSFNDFYSVHNFDSVTTAAVFYNNLGKKVKIKGGFFG